MSRTVIVTVDAIETITKTVEIIVRVPGSISDEEIEDLVVGLDLPNRVALDWTVEYQDFEAHGAKVTERIEGGDKTDVVIRRLGEEFVAEVDE